jgi:hypothetical protein
VTWEAAEVQRAEYVSDAPVDVGFPSAAATMQRPLSWNLTPDDEAASYGINGTAGDSLSAGAILRGDVFAPRPVSAADITASVHAISGPYIVGTQPTTTAVPELPALAISASPEASDDAVLSLFGSPFDSQLTGEPGWSDHLAYDDASTQPFLVAPGAPMVPTNLDGLDGLEPLAESTDSGTGYLETDLSDIQPYFDYSPTGQPVCRDSGDDVSCPAFVPMPDEGGDPNRYFAEVDTYWLPSNVFHRPLYFEDPALERYGHTHGDLVQPLVSTGRFGVQLIGLPYQMALDPPRRRVYPLGYFRPGECAPKQCQPIPLNAKAAAISGAVYTGLIFAFP